jgi:amino acid permease
MAFGKQGLVAKHWRGEYSVARSFWLHYLFGLIVVVLMTAFVETVIGVFGSIIVIVGAFVWGMVGTWRSAKKVQGGGGRKLVRIFLVAQLVVVIGGFLLVLMYVVLFAIAGPQH